MTYAFGIKPWEMGKLRPREVERLNAVLEQMASR